MENFHGFKAEKQTLGEREILIVFPKEGTANGKWALKSEYFEAFPDVQIKLLEKGYHIAHVYSKARLCYNEDTPYRAKLAEYMNEKYGLSKKCAVIGMSCGGLQGVYFAARYPECVSCLYLDAPVINLLSWPAGVGGCKEPMLDELKESTGMTLIDLMSYRDHPLDNITKLIENKIPVILVCGDSDDVVPYEENGKLFDAIYSKSGLPYKHILKPGCGHHPHSLEDNTEIIDFIMENDC